jgi:hypothetical protein
MSTSLSTEGQPVPTLRFGTEKATGRALRQVIFQHNLHVAVLTLGSLVAAAVAWALLYVGSLWLLILGMTALIPDRAHIPNSYGYVFAVAGACATAYAWLDQWLTPDGRVRDKRGIGEIIVDFILLVPRLTLAVGGNLRAWLHLSRTEYAQTAALLQRLTDEKRVAMSSLRQEIPDSQAVRRILFALQLTEIVEVQRKENEFWLRLNDLRPKALRAVRGSAEGS